MISRRQFVRIIAIAGATALTAACGPAAPPAGAPTSAPPPPAPKPAQQKATGPPQDTVHLSDAAKAAALGDADHDGDSH